MSDAMDIRRPYTPQELAGKIIEAAETEPDSFDMAHWIRNPQVGQWCASLTAFSSPSGCGTTLCANGWGIHISGYDIKDGELVFLEGEEEALAARHGYPSAFGLRYHLNIWVALGAELLGLAYMQADHLFSASEEDALHHLRQIADGDGFQHNCAHR